MAKHDRITTVLSTKGQVILPKAIREQRRWTPGTRLAVENTADGVLLTPMPAFPATGTEAVFGSLRHKGAPLSIEDMNAAIEREGERRARD